MNSPSPSSAASELEKLRLVLEQFHQDIHELRLGKGKAKQIFGRDEYKIFESASEQAKTILQLCNHTLVNLLQPFIGNSAVSFLHQLRTSANLFINYVQFKYGSLSEDEEEILDNLKPKIKDFHDSVQSGSLLTQSNSAPLVILGSQKEEPVVCGIKQKRLTIAQYSVVKVLFDAEKPLTKDQLIEKSGKNDAVNILKRVAKKSDWGKVIQLAGAPGRGYFIKR